MHHEPQLSAEISKKFADMLLGPTGAFPEGKLTENDEGELAFAVGTLKQKVVINFNTPIASLGMTPNQARDLASVLWQHARGIDGITINQRRRRKGGQ